MLILHLGLALALIDPGLPLYEPLKQCYNSSGDICCRRILADFIISVLQHDFRISPAFIYSTRSNIQRGGRSIKFWCYDTRVDLGQDELREIGPYKLDCAPFARAMTHYTVVKWGLKSPAKLKCSTRDDLHEWMEYVREYESDCLDILNDEATIDQYSRIYNSLVAIIEEPSDEDDDDDPGVKDLEAWLSLQEDGHAMIRQDSSELSIENPQSPRYSACAGAGSHSFVLKAYFTTSKPLDEKMN